MFSFSFDLLSSSVISIKLSEVIFCLHDFLICRFKLLLLEKFLLQLAHINFLIFVLILCKDKSYKSSSLYLYDSNDLKHKFFYLNVFSYHFI
jgi:hypothetical protein